MKHLQLCLFESFGKGKSITGDQGKANAVTLQIKAVAKKCKKVTLILKNLRLISPDSSNTHDLDGNGNGLS